MACQLSIYELNDYELQEAPGSLKSHVWERCYHPRRPHGFSPWCEETSQTQTYLIHVLEGVDDVVGQAGQQVDDEPRLQVVHADELGIGDDFSTGPHEGGVEVEDDVHQEDDVHHAVQHQPHDVVLLGLEGDVVGHHDGRVEGEDEDDPVPGGLEGAVVKDDVRRRLRGLLLVLREDVRVQLQHLETRGSTRAS